MYLLNRFRRMSVRPSRRRNQRGSHPPIEGLESRSLLSGHSLVGALGSLEGTGVEHHSGSEASTQQTSPVRDEDIRNGGFSSSTVNAIREMDLRNGGFGSSTVNPLQADGFFDVYSDEFFDVWVELGKTGAGIDDDYCFPATRDHLADGAIDSRALTIETSPLREEDIRNGGFGSSTVHIVGLAEGEIINRGTAVGNPGDASLAGGNQNRLDEVTFTIAESRADHVGIPVYFDVAQPPGHNIGLAEGQVINRGTAVGNPGDASLAGGNRNRLDEVTFTIAASHADHVGIPVYFGMAQQPASQNLGEPGTGPWGISDSGREDLMLVPGMNSESGGDHDYSDVAQPDDAMSVYMYISGPDHGPDNIAADGPTFPFSQSGSESVAEEYPASSDDADSDSGNADESTDEDARRKNANLADETSGGAGGDDGNNGCDALDEFFGTEVCSG